MCCLFLVCSGYQDKVPQTGWLKQQIFIVLQFWSLEGQDQSVAALVSAVASVLTLKMAVFSLSSYSLPGVCVCALISSIRTEIILDQDPRLWPHFNPTQVSL